MCIVGLGLRAIEGMIKISRTSLVRLLQLIQEINQSNGICQNYLFFASHADINVETLCAAVNTNVYVKNTRFSFLQGGQYWFQGVVKLLRGAKSPSTYKGGWTLSRGVECSSLPS